MNISVELINAILNYLSKRPFNEVNGLVGQLMLEARQDQENSQQDGGCQRLVARDPLPELDHGARAVGANDAVLEERAQVQSQLAHVRVAVRRRARHRPDRRRDQLCAFGAGSAAARLRCRSPGRALRPATAHQR